MPTLGSLSTEVGGPTLLVISIGTMVVAVLSSVVCFAVRFRMNIQPKKLGWDDYAIAAAVVYNSQNQE